MTDALAQFVEEHGAAVVADNAAQVGLLLAVVGRDEVPQGEGLALVGVGQVPADGLVAVGDPFATVFALAVVGKIGGQPLAPVALAGVDLDGVAEPGVDDLVGEGGVLDEGQAQHRAAEEGEGGDAEAAGQAVGDDGVVVVGVGAEFPLVAP